MVVLEAGQHKWNFELPLPGNLPQSLESDAGSVSYRLKATIERPAFIQNIIKKKIIRIQRCVIPSQFELVQSLEVRSTLADKIVYDISAPSKIYAFGDKIPITFKIEPLASTLKVHTIRAALKEYCTYRANDRSKTDTRTVCQAKLEHPFASSAATIEKVGHTWKRVIELSVPPQSPMIFADTESDLIRIRHRLKFLVSLVNAAGQISELRSAVQVTMLESFAVTEELTSLPAYDEMWRSIPYSHDVLEQLRTQQQSIAEVEPTISELTASRQPLTVTGWSRLLSLSSETVPLSTASTSRASSMSGQDAVSSNASEAVNSSANSIQDEDFQGQHDSNDSQWWDGVDLAKVPSYRTVASIDSAIISNSLAPAYESLPPRHVPRP